jgi:hypothetical protein
VEIAFRCHWLVQEGKVMSATRPWLVVRVEVITESEWTVVECEATGRAVVAVEVSLAVANASITISILRAAQSAMLL